LECAGAIATGGEKELFTNKVPPRHRRLRVARPQVNLNLFIAHGQTGEVEQPGVVLREKSWRLINETVAIL